MASCVFGQASERVGPSELVVGIEFKRTNQIQALQRPFKDPTKSSKTGCAMCVTRTPRSDWKLFVSPYPEHF